ncbi:MAG: HAMP domain-containing protein [Gloeocapsa sp. DLM2.Bin57]|nr:MAG: HAMP domain-containing protein [Gloeocapsa sp. DLM2.Bin57]
MTKELEITKVEKIPLNGQQKSAKLENKNLKLPEAPLQRWFAKLPINRKQLTILLLSQLLSILGITGLGAYLILRTGNDKLISQSQSEAEVTRINYMIKINQMGFGFRGQADNVAIIEAAVLASQGQAIPPELEQQVRQILRGEIIARRIEYATLVGVDQRIIINANNNRKGEIFNPENLVTQVRQTGEQFRASAIVSKDELMKEGSPLAAGLATDNALIRYTATPVKEPGSNQIIAVLISGDIVNGKLPIVRDTVESFRGGYSAVYYRNADGSFSLASSLKQLEDGKQIADVPLSELEVLQGAVNNPQESVTQQDIEIEGEEYTVTATTLPNIWQETAGGLIPKDADNPPIAILIRGTPERDLNELLTNTLLIQLGVASLALLLSIWLANLLTRAIAGPIEKLQQATERFAKGDRRIRAPITTGDEVGELAKTFNYLADNITESEQEKSQQIRQKELFNQILQAKNAQELSQPLEAVLQEALRELKVDRLLVYRFLPDGIGYLASEVVREEYPQVLEEENLTSLLNLESLNSYLQGEIISQDNIDEINYDITQLQLLKRLKVKSNLIVPILQGQELFGLLIAHHCQNYHNWQPTEIEYSQSLATNLAQALGGLALIESKQKEAERTEAQSRQIQEELLNLLNDVEGAASGNLTVRANITEGQIGIVADFFNVILENLRDIVTQVKQTTTEVNQSLKNEAKSIYQLTDESREQAQKIQQMLNSVQDMSQSIQAITENAGSAASVARNASNVAKAGEEGMTQTVDSILNLRDTVSNTAKKVKRLGEASQKISKVIALINEIALKTNLLAVNASIEAARAGEEGRGFAVVAEEVGQLAAQSATATKEIEQIVETIQLETQEVVEAMEIGTTQVIQGTDLVTKAKESLAQIVSESQQIDQLVQIISLATVSQTATSQELTDLMQEIAVISNQTAASAQKISSSLETTVASAVNLQASVETFTVE